MKNYWSLSSTLGALNEVIRGNLSKVVQIRPLCLLSIALGLAIPLWWVAGSYYGIDVASSLVFFGSDGSCADLIKPIGVHCFGDYAASARRAISDNPWSSENTYAPYLGGAYAVFRFFGDLGEFAGNANLGLVLYLAALATCLSLPVLLLSKEEPKIGVPSHLLFFAGAVSIPGLTALDRGNNVALVVPGLFLFLRGLQFDRRQFVVLGIVLTSFVKPQFVLLIVAPLIFRQWSVVFTAIGWSVTAQISAYLLWPESLPADFFDSIRMMLNYNDYASIATPYPPQISTAHGLWYVADNLPFFQVSSKVVLFLQNYAGLLLLTCFSAVGIFRTQHLSKFVIGASTIALVSLAPATTWAYYSVFVLPILVLSAGSPNSSSASQKESHIMLFLINVVVVFTMVPFPLSFVSIVGYQAAVVSTTRSIVPVLWILVAFVSLFSRHVNHQHVDVAGRSSEDLTDIK